MRKLRASDIVVLIHVLALLPLLLLVWHFTQGQLTVNPIQEIQLRTGKYALVLLVLSLSCTPIYIVFGIKAVLRLRRALGLYAFMYAALHFLNFVGLDYGFDFVLIREGIAEKRFALIGFVAFLGLLPLALTSTGRWRQRLGKNWERLHWSVYLAAVLAVTHFTWQVKADLREPLLYWVVLVLLFILRVPYIREKLSEFRHKVMRK